MKSMGYAMKTNTASSLQGTKKPPKGAVRQIFLTLKREFPPEITEVRRICQSSNEQKEKKNQKKKKLREQRSAFIALAGLNAYPLRRTLLTLALTQGCGGESIESQAGSGSRGSWGSGNVGLSWQSRRTEVKKEDE